MNKKLEYVLSLIIILIALVVLIVLIKYPTFLSSHAKFLPGQGPG